MSEGFSTKELADALAVSPGSTTRRFTKFQQATEAVILSAACSLAPRAGNAENLSRAFRAWLRTAAALYRYDEPKTDAMIDAMIRQHTETLNEANKSNAASAAN